MYVHLLYINSTQNSPAFQNDQCGFLFCAPKTIPTDTKMNSLSVRKGLKKADFKDSLILKVVTSIGGSHCTWGHNYSTMEKDAGF